MVFDMPDMDERAKRIERLSNLQTGGGPPYDPGMEARIAKIEGAVEHMATKEAVARIDGRIDTLAEKVSNLPTKTYILTTIIGLLAVIAALIAFQGQIQDLLSVPPSSR